MQIFVRKIVYNEIHIFKDTHSREKSLNIARLTNRGVLISADTCVLSHARKCKSDRVTSSCTLVYVNYDGFT